MNNIRKYTAWLGAGAIMITLATGCATQQEAVGNVAESAVEGTGNVVDGAVDTTGNVVGGAADTMAPAGQAIENSVEAGASNVAGAGDAAIYTPKIKTALGAEAALAGSKIDVDTLGDKKEIALRGTVTSSAQMKMAEAVAKKNAPADYTVVNQLTMEGAM